MAYGAAARLRNLAVAASLLAMPVATPAAADPLTLVALGDSLTQGYGLPQQEGFVPQLQSWLQANGAEVTVVNAGVSGDTSAGGLARLGWTLEGGADAMIVALGGNDLLRGLPPEETRANIDAILAEASAQGLPVLLIGLPAPGNYGADYKTDFDAIWPELAEQYGALMVPNMLAGLSDVAPDQRAGLVQPDGLHPSAAGVAVMVETLGPEVLKLLEMAN
ncbi:MAG: arylesterase [Frigidibacter sp.]|nr:arylesterase [Frigidibacter sp.]MDP3341468.1 arylesterase [Frigidibacter sp.]